MCQFFGPPCTQKLILLKYEKVATKYPWIYEYFHSVDDHQNV